MKAMDPTLQSIIQQRLGGELAPSETAQILILAACEGPADLDEVLEGAVPETASSIGGHRPSPSGRTCRA